MGIRHSGTFNGWIRARGVSMRQGDEDEEVVAADRSALRHDGGPGALPGEKVVEVDHEAPG